MTNKNTDKAKGRVKEAAGALTGDRHLKNEGRVDQAKGSAKGRGRQLFSASSGTASSKPRSTMTRAAQSASTAP